MMATHNAWTETAPERQDKMATHTVITTKDNNGIDVEEYGEKHTPQYPSLDLREHEPEPPTTRWELWAWYGYYFGNNSAGTLSYAPLSESNVNFCNLWICIPAY